MNQTAMVDAFPLPVVPEDWEEVCVDLSPFIRQVNGIKKGHPVFQEEAPTEVLPNSNPNVLVMWKGSVRSPEESLLILNKDIHNRQTFSTARIHDLVQAGAPLVDVSPGIRLDYIPEPFSYELAPGQGLVLITNRDVVPED